MPGQRLMAAALALGRSGGEVRAGTETLALTCNQHRARITKIIEHLPDFIRHLRRHGVEAIGPVQRDGKQAGLRGRRGWFRRTFSNLSLASPRPRAGAPLSSASRVKRSGAPDQVRGDDCSQSDQWVPSFGVSMISVSIPPMSFGWTKKIGVPCAPMRVGPRMRLPSSSNSARASAISGTSKHR